MAFIQYDTPYVNIWWRLVLMGSGISLYWIIGPNFGLHQVPEKFSGKGASIFEIGRYSGIAILLNVAQVWFIGAMNLNFNQAWQQLKISGIPPTLSTFFHDPKSIVDALLALHPAHATQLKIALAQSIQSGFSGAMWTCVIISALGVGLTFWMKIPHNR